MYLQFYTVTFGIAQISKMGLLCDCKMHSLVEI